MSPSRRVGSSAFFPLPPVLNTQIPTRNFSRGVQQRVGRRAKRIHDVNACVNGLNWMAGYQRADISRPVVRSHPVHPEVLGLIDQAVGERGAPPFDLSPEEAARVLLRAKAGYDLGETSVAAFVPGRVALPDDNLTTGGLHLPGMCSPSVAVSSSKVSKRRCCDAVPSFSNSRTMGVRSSLTWTAYWRKAATSMWVSSKSSDGEV